MASKQTSNRNLRKEPKIRYASEKQVRAAAKAAFLFYGEAFRELAKR